jgi:hypothetical protein
MRRKVALEEIIDRLVQQHTQAPPQTVLSELSKNLKILVNRLVGRKTAPESNRRKGGIQAKPSFESLTEECAARRLVVARMTIYYCGKSNLGP